jgi:hypothetical protein
VLKGESATSRACLRRRVTGVAALATLALCTFALAPSGASAVFSQCPPVGVDTGCQFLITLTGGAPTIQQDPAQQPYEQSEDSLIGVQNNSSRAVAALPLSAPGLFSFDADGICNPNLGTTGAVPPGCVPAPGSAPGTICGPQFGTCSFPKPPGQPAGYVEPGAPVGNTQNGYEGPDTWFSAVSTDRASGTVNFSPQLKPGKSSYFGLEAPPSLQQLKVGTPVAGKPTFGSVVKLPSSKKCVSRRKFNIHIRQRNGIKIQTALVFLNGKKIRVFKARYFRKLRHTANVNLRGLPKGTFVVRIVVLTTKGETLKGKRKYHTCRKKKRKPKHAPKL